MLGYIEIASIYFLTHLIFSRQGEASKDKIDAGKTPRSVSLRGFTYFAYLSAKTNL